MARHDNEAMQRSRSWLRSSWLLLLACGTVALLFHSSGRSTIPDSSSFSALHGRRDLTAREQGKLPSGIRRPPQAPGLFNDSPETVKEKTKKYIDAEKRVVDGIVKNIDLANATFENTIIPFIEQSDQGNILLAALSVYDAVSNDTALRDAVTATRPNITEAAQETYLNLDLFKRVDAVFQTQKDDKTLTAESRKLLEKMREDFVDEGIKLSGEKRRRFRDDGQKLVKLSSDFVNAIKDDKTALWFTAEELNGADPSIVNSLEKGKGEHKGKLKVIVQSPEAGEIIGRCTNATTRQRLGIAGT